mmetsp:Transcript_10460/g.32019  ORF Transcript_10460/g.32019 Transcript_10460/m.32019 type:complete len:209 (-) Transcript_10460:584-1210(-)
MVVLPAACSAFADVHGSADLRLHHLPSQAHVRAPHILVPERLGPSDLDLAPQPPRHHPPEAWEEVCPLQSSGVPPRQACHGVVVPSARGVQRGIPVEEGGSGREVREEVRGDHEVVLHQDGARKAEAREARREGELVVPGDAVVGAHMGLHGTKFLLEGRGWGVSPPRADQARPREAVDDCRDLLVLSVLRDVHGESLGDAPGPQPTL